MKHNAQKAIAGLFVVIALALVPAWESLGNALGEEDGLGEPPDSNGAGTAFLLQGQGAFLALSLPSNQPEQQQAKNIAVIVTAYSSTPEETDDTPHITASGTPVREGIVAANFLPIGTKIKIPVLYGDKIFVVEDRMHPRKVYQVDIWFSDTIEALEFGARQTFIEVVEG